MKLIWVIFTFLVIAVNPAYAEFVEGIIANNNTVEIYNFPNPEQKGRRLLGLVACEDKNQNDAIAYSIEQSIASRDWEIRRIKISTQTNEIGISLVVKDFNSERILVDIDIPQSSSCIVSNLHIPN